MVVAEVGMAAKVAGLATEAARVAKAAVVKVAEATQSTRFFVEEFQMAAAGRSPAAFYASVHARTSRAWPIFRLQG